MNQEIINALSEKIGIAIDWTAENVVPQITEFIERYRTYSIVVNAAWLVVGIICLFIAIHYVKEIFKCGAKGDDWCDSEYITGAVLVLSIAAIVIFIPVIISNIHAILEWSFVPEARFLDLLTAKE